MAVLTTTTVRTLIKWLRGWEDFWLVMRETVLAAKQRGMTPPSELSGAVSHFTSLREWILSQGNRPSGLSSADFSPPLADGQWLSFYGTHLANFAAPLIGWSCDSRRVYCVDGPLQTVLANLSLDGVTWDDIQLPARSYAIKLAIPFVDAEGDRFDFILVNTSSVEVGEKLVPRLELHLFRETSNTDGLLSSIEKMQLSKFRQQRRWHDLGQLQRKAIATQGRCFTAYWFYHLEADFSRSVLQLPPESGLPTIPLITCEVRGLDEVKQYIARIAVGLVLYLRGLPSPDSHTRSRREEVRLAGPSSSVIFRDTDICDVASRWVLGAEEQQVLGSVHNIKQRRAYELNFHFREGHYRRPPGCGKNPSVAKTVTVRPTFVRKDRKPSDGLHGGGFKQ